MAISRSSGDVIVRCNRFLADLYAWLLAHIEGDVSISIAGKIIHRATSGRPLRSVTMLADEACSDSHGKVTSTLILSVNVGGTLRTMLRYTASQADGCGSLTNARRSLYDLEGFSRAARLDTILTGQEMREIRIAGQRIVGWLTARPAIADHDSQIVYRTELGALSNESGPLTVGALLSRWPTIFNIDYGAGTSGYSFQDPDHLDGGDDREAATMSIRQILNCFPHARTIIAHACRRCWCTCCRNEVTMDINDHAFWSKPGCLAYMVENHLCLILAHAVADGFGIPDASNLGDFSIVRNGVQKLMSELISWKRIAWATWFSLAACTYLGCEWTGTTADAGEGSAELIAIQHGSAVVVAPWIEIRSNLMLQGSFGCSIATGQLCGMATDFGVLYTEMTTPPAVGEAGQSHLLEYNVSETAYVLGQPDFPQVYSTIQTSSRARVHQGHHSPPRSPGHHQSATLDNSEISIQTAISGVAGTPFKLMMLAKAGDYLRIINPATAFMALGRSAWPKCEHAFVDPHDVQDPPSNSRSWSMVDALGQWGDLNVSDIRYFAAIDIDPVNINILLTLSPHGCTFLNRQDCCIPCYEAVENCSAWTSNNRRVVSVAKTNLRRPNFASPTPNFRYQGREIKVYDRTTNQPQ